MAHLTAKELSSLHDLLSSEELLIKKFQMLADATQDPQLKDQFTNISARHQSHFNTIYSHLK